MKILALLAAVFVTSLACAQEQVDLGDAAKKGGASLQKLTIRVRATRATPATEKVRIAWRHGGEGLGGTVTRGEFAAEGGAAELGVNEWSAWAPAEAVVGRGNSWGFATIVVEGAIGQKVGVKKAAAAPLEATTVELAFAEGGKVFKTFTEDAPKGATVGFAFPFAKFDGRGAANPEFVAALRGLSEYARDRREGLEKVTPKDAVLPKQFAIVGHLGGYGEGAPGARSGGSGYGVRYCNPAIVADECRAMRMLGMNGFVGRLAAVDAAGFGEQFRRMYWGGPGSGDPMSFFARGGKSNEEPDGCPFDPALKPYVAETVQRAIEEHRAVGAKESWALWDDEMGVYAKAHIARCERCAEKFRDYVRGLAVPLAELGAAKWEEVKPFDLWGDPAAAKTAKGKKGAAAPAPVPANAAEALRYYYTYRFMTYATGQVYPEAARTFKAAGIPLYAMQGPTPSWSGASLDWNEFYDLDANTAFVFETSNRDPRSWQWESYLGDIGRGIAARHAMPMGALVKPHRGAPAQRMLTLVARGTRVIEWYTYGPDYSKGDSFSQNPELLVRVAQAAQFLGKAEDFLYGAQMAPAPRAAFVTPRSSEIWGRPAGLDLTAFENAKWVYLALAHAHVPVDILSEQQLAEGKLDGYKLLYVPGPNLRRDSAAQVEAWVRKGGTLWTDALGLSRDEANQPAAALREMTGLGERKLESWGSVEGYKATAFKPMTETNVPAGATFDFRGAKIQAAIGREALETKSAEPLAKFADGKVALARHRHGQGEVIVAGLWTGLTYSAKVRRADYDMRADFDAAIRRLVSFPATDLKLAPFEVSEPLVEAVALENKGRRGVALMNWTYSSTEGKQAPIAAENVKVIFAAGTAPKKVRSQVHGELPVKDNAVVVPKIEEIDLLLLE